MDKYLDVLGDIIEKLNKMHAELQLDNLRQQADKVAVAREELFWLWYDLSERDDGI